MGVSVVGNHRRGCLRSGSYGLPVAGLLPCWRCLWTVRSFSTNRYAPHFAIQTNATNRGGESPSVKRGLAKTRAHPRRGGGRIAECRSYDVGTLLHVFSGLFPPCAPHLRSSSR